MLDLTFDDQRVSWCVTDVDLARLRAAGITHPVLVLVASSLDEDDVPEQTGVWQAPLSLGYLPNVTFKRPGRHVLQPVIVNVDSAEREKNLRHELRFFDVFGYSVRTMKPQVPFATAKDYNNNEFLAQHDSTDDVIVQVDESMFASPASAPTRFVIKTVFGRVGASPRDECNQRWLALRAWTFVWLTVPVRALVKLLFLFFVLLSTWSRPNVRAALDPRVSTFAYAETLRESGGRVRLAVKKNGELNDRALISTLVVVWFGLIPGLAAGAGRRSYLVNLAANEALMGGIVAVFSAFLLAAYVVAYFMDDDTRRAWRPRTRSASPTPVCDRTKLSDVPLSQRTVSLYYNEVKSRVCRPFAR